ncbi:hypothetical protein AG1IA_01334 [Rhizoctonia solani AG-1 IA]|uniref:Uncharacterized protein n=1 Tax=Thanatephorus cucumeris (strain AG1-IA) TaxID=983506 RepID=L8X6B9_THACA|nr:hypothetical protein AG1IA_01334 [Rhizoctonia solani AG-1 IA]
MNWFSHRVATGRYTTCTTRAHEVSIMVLANCEVILEWSNRCAL